MRTDAPRGHTPLLRVPLTHDHLAAISGITPAGQLLLLVQERAIQGAAAVRFLQPVPRHLPGKLLVIWDGAPIHRSRLVKQFLADGGARRIHLERLPGYAPDLNPDEGIWDYRTRVELGNVCCTDMAHLRRALRTAAGRLRRKRRVIQGCIRQAGYHL